MPRRCFGVLLAVLLLPGCASAQVNPDSVHQRNQCRLAAQVIETGHPAPRRAWAYSFVSVCGREGAHAVASRFEALRSSRDTALLADLTFSVREMRSRELFTTALSIARDHAATDVARAFAFRMLTWIVRPDADLEAFTPWSAEGTCIGTVFDRASFEVDPLPADYRDQIRQVAVSTFRDRTNPEAVRRAAYCTMTYGGW